MAFQEKLKLNTFCEFVIFPFNLIYCDYGTEDSLKHILIFRSHSNGKQNWVSSKNMKPNIKTVCQFQLHAEVIHRKSIRQVGMGKNKLIP